MAQYRDSIIACTVILLIANTVAVAARVYSRLRITESFGADDAMLCLTYVCEVSRSPVWRASARTSALFAREPPFFRHDVVLTSDLVIRWATSCCAP